MTPLTSWKEISSYLGRTVRTAQRWERSLQLPIHRPIERRAEIVWAYREELDKWLELLGKRRPAAVDRRRSPRVVPVHIEAICPGLDALPLPSSLFDVERQRFVMANRQYCRLVGYSESELLQIDWKRLFPGRYNVLAQKAITQTAPSTAICWTVKAKNARFLHLTTRYRRIPIVYPNGAHSTAMLVVVTRVSGERARDAARYYK